MLFLKNQQCFLRYKKSSYVTNAVECHRRSFLCAHAHKQSRILTGCDCQLPSPAHASGLSTLKRAGVDGTVAWYGVTRPLHFNSWEHTVLLPKNRGTHASQEDKEMKCLECIAGSWSIPPMSSLQCRTTKNEETSSYQEGLCSSDSQSATLDWQHQHHLGMC